MPMKLPFKSVYIYVLKAVRVDARGQLYDVGVCLGLTASLLLSFSCNFLIGFQPDTKRQVDPLCITSA